MAKLTELGTSAGIHEAHLRPDALVWWFSRIEKYIDGIVAASSFSTQLVKVYDATRTARKKRAASRRARK